MELHGVFFTVSNIHLNQSINSPIVSVTLVPKSEGFRSFTADIELIFRHHVSVEEMQCHQLNPSLQDIVNDSNQTPACVSLRSTDKYDAEQGGTSTSTLLSVPPWRDGVPMVVNY